MVSNKKKTSVKSNNLKENVIKQVISSKKEKSPSFTSCDSSNSEVEKARKCDDNKKNSISMKDDSSSDSDSSEEEAPKKVVAPVKTAVVAKKDDSSSDSDSSEEEAPKKVVAPVKTAVVAKKDDSSSDSDSSEEEAPKKVSFDAKKNGRKRVAESSDTEPQAKRSAPEMNGHSKSKRSLEDSDQGPVAKKVKTAPEEFDCQPQAVSTPIAESRSQMSTINVSAITNARKRKSSPFRRVKDEDWVKGDKDCNSFTSIKNSQSLVGNRAFQDLRFTQGKSFRHEKNKKKRGSFVGGEISMQNNSVKFD